MARNINQQLNGTDSLTAATIIRQIIHTYNPIVRYALPVIDYLAAVLTVIYGWNYMHEAATASNFVAGHVICGVGFITACVATTATASTRFTLIPANSERTDQLQPADAFNSSQGYILIAVATLMAVMAWIWAFWLLSKSSEHNAYYVAGHVMAGLACICSSLVALVATSEPSTRYFTVVAPKTRAKEILVMMYFFLFSWRE